MDGVRKARDGERKARDDAMSTSNPAPHPKATRKKAPAVPKVPNKKQAQLPHN